MSLQWMVSALARAGWVDHLNYFYGIAGWSYTHVLPGSVVDHYSSSSSYGSGTSESSGGTETSISAHLHAVRLAITHYFAAN
jgi:hypothetical protein